MSIAAVAPPSTADEEEESRQKHNQMANRRHQLSCSPPRKSSHSRLHNFSFPTLSWGNRRLLRCVKLPPEEAAPPPSPSPSPSAKRKRSPSPSPTAVPERPWNLRTRRAAGYAPKYTDELQQRKRQQRNPISLPPPPSSPKKGERRPFSVALSRYEIEHDFLSLTGAKPPRRPKKRPRAVQRQLDLLQPGMWLSGITPDSYKVDP